MGCLVRLVEPLAEVLKQLGSRHVMVVHADDGMDEISISSATSVAELKDGEITHILSAEDFAMTKSDLSSIKAADSACSLNIIKSVFDNQLRPCKRYCMFECRCGYLCVGL